MVLLPVPVISLDKQFSLTWQGRERGYMLVTVPQRVFNNASHQRKEEREWQNYGYWSWAL